MLHGARMAAKRELRCSVSRVGQWPLRAVCDDSRGRYLADAAPHPMAAVSPFRPMPHNALTAAIGKIPRIQFKTGRAPHVGMAAREMVTGG